MSGSVKNNQLVEVVLTAPPLLLVVVVVVVAGSVPELPRPHFLVKPDGSNIMKRSLTGFTRK